MYRKAGGKYKYFAVVVGFALCYSFFVPAIKTIISRKNEPNYSHTYTMVAVQVDSFENCEYVVNPYEAYSYEQLVIDLQNLQKMYPELFHVYSIGKSVEGRELLAFDFGRGDRIITMNGSIHAREYITSGFLMYMVDRYAYGYAKDESWDGYSIRETLNNVTFSIVPMINPDGVNLAQNGADATQNPDGVKEMLSNKNAKPSEWKANVRGVDLNRNFSSRWKSGEEKAPAHAEFGGFSTVSEPETKAMEQYLSTVPFYLNMSLHAQGEVIFWLDRETAGLEAKYSPVVKRIAEELHYTQLPITKNEENGLLADYLNDNFAKVNMTVEICPMTNGNFPEKDFDSMAKNLKKIGLVAASEVMKMEEMKFWVYQKDELLQIFDTQSYAEEFAKRYAESSVVMK